MNERPELHKPIGELPVHAAQVCSDIPLLPFSRATNMDPSSGEVVLSVALLEVFEFKICVELTRKERRPQCHLVVVQKPQVKATG